jgi:UDPglucose--hexose-1-phosphate uridylyltransferase
MKPELRKDYLEDRYAVIAPVRAKRFGKDRACPFCNSTTRVLVNKYPAFSPSYPKAYGRQEVVIDTPKHDALLADLSVGQIADLVGIYGERLKEMKKDKRIKQVIVFKNHGVEAGASKVHEHSQIIGMEFISPHLEDKMHREHIYQAKTGRCPYCDIIKNEAKSSRLIISDRNVFAFAPFASQYAYEARIFPRRHLDNVSDLTNAERESMAHALKGILLGLKELGMPYNFYMHERVMDRDQHFYIKVAPRGARLGPVEIGMGFNINPVSPEDAAHFYRKSFRR